MQRISGGENYTVEYRFEEKDQGCDYKHKLQAEEQLALVCKIRKSLSLKRPRLTYVEEGLKEKEAERNKKKKEDAQGQIMYDAYQYTQSQLDTIMAKEAGLPMPLPRHEYSRLELSGFGCGPDNEGASRHMYKAAANYCFSYGDQSP